MIIKEFCNPGWLEIWASFLPCHDPINKDILGQIDKKKLTLE